MAGVDRIEKLECWQLGMELAAEAYRIASSRQFQNDRSLSYQIRRCSTSIPYNLAEGFGRSSSNDFAHFVDIARGSTFELATLLRLSKVLGVLAEGEYNRLIGKVDTLIPMLTALAKYLRSRKSPYR